MRLSLTINRSPIGKSVRVGRKGKFSAMYNANETTWMMQEIATMFKMKYRSHKPFEGAVMFILTSYLPIGSSYKKAWGLTTSVSKATRKLMEDGVVKPIVKPDLSNILKLVEDALTGLAWHDDAQITDEVLRKRFSSKARMEMTIYG